MPEQMSTQILLNRTGFMRALTVYAEQIQAWEQQSQELLKELDELSQGWKGNSSKSYMEGYESLCAHSIQRERSLLQLHMDAAATQKAMIKEDEGLAKSVASNYSGR